MEGLGYVGSGVLLVKDAASDGLQGCKKVDQETERGRKDD